MTWHVIVIVALVAVVVREMERLRHRAERAEWQRDIDATEEALQSVTRERDALLEQSGARGARLLSLVDMDGQLIEGRRALQRREGLS